jgi:hypothetical protein
MVQNFVPTSRQKKAEKRCLLQQTEAEKFSSSR